ncbi:MAG TPA: hypothetical protein VMS12_09405 [Thermoanaerobaculia bacterium]|nr:hypothetical protein [Thermoanaerobaculia bacterium]
MKEDTAAGLALITSVLGIAITMLLHPTGHDVLRSAQQAEIAVLVHGLGLATIPVALFGFLVYTKRLSHGTALPTFSYILFAFGSVAILGAAVASGFVGPAVGDQLRTAAGAEREVLRVLFHTTGQVNRAFARIHVLSASLAILLWSVSMWRSRLRACAACGIIVGAASIAAVGSGHLILNVHGAGLVYLAHGVWTVWVAALLIRGSFSHAPS